MAKIATGEVIGRDAPFIGHNVYIGPGAKLYGPIDVGDDCTIGANAVVTKSFAEPALVLAGVPAKIIARQSSAERLIKGADPKACPQ